MAASKESGLMPIEYDTALGHIKLTVEDVKNYLVSGNSQVTDRELKLFMELCRYQKLNPFTGEAYAIKFGSEFQMVVGYETYKRRAEENPNYRGRQSGIVVMRNNDVVKKEGTCLYPTETLIGGWCRVFVNRPEFKDEMYKEVSLAEYQKMKDGKPSANWATKPATMIEKVAVSQALRAAFPMDYQGLYTAEEFGESGKITEDTIHEREEVVAECEVFISQEQRQEMFNVAAEFYGEKKANSIIKYICNQFGLESTTNMTVSVYDQAMEFLHTGIEADKRKAEEAAAAKESEDKKAENAKENVE